MNADVLTARVADGIAIVILGSARRIYFDEEMLLAARAREIARIAFHLLPECLGRLT